MKVKFKIGPLQSVHGIVRFHLIQLEPSIILYASPVNFDPAAPLFPISAPPEYARQLAGDIGKYYTTGMVEDHNGLINERISEEAFLAQCDDAWRERRAMMERELSRFDAGLFYCLFDTPDRVQHMLWRFREPEHPANRGRPPAPGLERAIEDHYRRGDEVVGQVLDHCRRPDASDRPERSRLQQLSAPVPPQLVAAGTGAPGASTGPVARSRGRRVPPGDRLEPDPGVRDGPERAVPEPSGARGAGDRPARRRRRRSSGRSPRS